MYSVLKAVLFKQLIEWYGQHLPVFGIQSLAKPQKFCHHQATLKTSFTSILCCHKSPVQDFGDDFIVDTLA